MLKRISFRVEAFASLVACLAGSPISAGVYVDCPPEAVLFPLPGLTQYEWDFVYAEFNGYGHLDNMRLSNPSTLFCLPEVDDEVAVAFLIRGNITIPSVTIFHMEGWEDDVEFWIDTGIVSGAVTTYATELTHLLLSVPDSQIQIRESPTLASLGQYIVTDLSVTGDSGCIVEGFFDVFFELSLDDGLNWISADGSGRMVLIPEPTALPLLVLGVMMMFPMMFLRRGSRKGNAAIPLSWLDSDQRHRLV